MEKSEKNKNDENNKEGVSLKDLLNKSRNYQYQILILRHQKNK